MLHGVEWLGRQYTALSKGPADNQSLIQTITTFATRLAQASQTENPFQERRAAILSLKGLAKDHAKEVGEHAGKQLLDCLVQVVSITPPKAANDDVARSLVESLLAICTPPKNPSQPAQFAGLKRPPPPSKGSPSLDLFLGSPQPMHALLPLLSTRHTFYLRFSALQLLSLLLRHRKTMVQSHVLTSPGGCRAILDCLSTNSSTGQFLGSSAEIVRNETLLLLPHLVDSNADIQKLVAFEGAFEKLLDVIAREGRIEGGVVVQDALEALEALLRYNVSNQNYFRETLSIPLLAPLLFFPPPLPPNAPVHLAAQRNEELERFSFQSWEYDASEDFAVKGVQGEGISIVGDFQKLTNAQLIIGVAGLLVQGTGEGRRANQNALFSTGFFHALLDLALGSSAPLPLKTQALQVLSSLLRSNRNVQDALGESWVSPVEPIKMQLAEELAHPTATSAQDSQLCTLVSEQQVPLSAFPATLNRMAEYARLPSQPALISLISAALDGVPPPLRPIDGGGRSSLGFRAAAVKALQSIFSDNIDARLYVVASMATSEQTRPEEQPGAILLEALTKLPSNGQQERFSEYRALFSGMILGSVIKGAKSVKDLARRIRYTPDGKVVILPEEAVEQNMTKAVSTSKSKKEKGNDDDDDAVSLLSVLVGNIAIAFRSQSDALRAERLHAVGSPAIKGPTSASWTRILLAHLSFLALWLHSSRSSVGDIVQDSSNLQTIVQLIAEDANGEHLLVGMGTWILGTIYEWGPMPSQAGQDSSLTRQGIYDLVTSRIGADQFQANLERLGDDPRLKLVGPDVLDKVSHHPDTIQAAVAAVKTGQYSTIAHLPLHRDSAASSSAADGKGEGAKTTAADNDEEIPELWFDWTFSEFWRHESATITNSILVPPATNSAADSAAPAELRDAQQQIEQLRDQVQKLQHELEIRNRLLTEGELIATEVADQQQKLQKQIEELKTAKGGHDNDLASLLREQETGVATMRLTHKSEVEHFQRSLDEAKTQVTRAADTSSSALTASQERMAAVEKGLSEERERREAAEEQARVLKEQLEALSEKEAAEDPEDQGDSQAPIAEAERRRVEAEAELKKIKAELKDAVEKHTKAQAEAEAKVKAAENKAAALEAKLASTIGGDRDAKHDSSGKGVTELEQEVEDLLICLDELTTKRKAEKAKLKEKGVEVSDDEEEDDNDNGVGKEG